MNDFETAQNSREPLEGISSTNFLSASDLETLTSLSYAAASVSLPSDLKQRLLARIVAEEQAQVADLASGLTSDLDLASDLDGCSTLFQLLSQSLETLKQQAEFMEWTPMGSLEEFEMATWKLDQATDFIAFFVRAKTGGQFPLHRHAEGEAVLVLDGDFVVGDQSYGVGDRIDSPAATSHAPATRTGCLLLCVSSVHDEILN